MRYGDYGSAQSGIQVTPLVRRTLITLVVIYILQLLLTKTQAGMELVGQFYLWPVRDPRWAPWQPLTCLFLNGPTPLAAFFDWLFLFFIMGPVETLMGTRRFLRGAAFAAGIALLFTLLLDAVGLLGMARPEFYVGLNPVLLALLVFFGLSMPNAQILLFFVLPVRASWVAWVSGLLSLLFFLYTPTLSTAMALGGWSGAWLWSSTGSGSFRRLVLRFRKAKLEQELQRFEVLPGGKEGDDDDWVH